MKTKLTFTTFLLIFGLGAVGFAQQSNEALSVAHALFKAGKYEQAKALYKKNIRVPGARAFIHQCDQAIQQGLGKNKTKTILSGVKIPLIEFEQLPIRDALDFLSQKVTEVSGGKARTNLIFAGSKKQAEDTLITLTLRQAPANVVLQYICQTGKCTASYDQYAVLISPNENLAKDNPNTAAEAGTSSAPKPAPAATTPSSTTGSGRKSTGSKSDIF